MYTVAQVLSPDFSRSWYESVALIQEIADTLGGLPSVPAAEDLFLEEDGTVSLGFAGERAENPVVSLATLLAGLLEGIEAPAALRTLAAENARPNPTHTTVARFRQALTFYERPDRRSDLRALAGRLATLPAPVDADAEVHRLRERIAAVEADPPPTAGHVRVEPKRLQIAAAAIIVVALVATVAAVRLVRVGAASPVSIATSAETAVAGVLSSGLKVVRGTAVDGVARGGTATGEALSTGAETLPSGLKRITGPPANGVVKGGAGTSGAVKEGLRADALANGLKRNTAPAMNGVVRAGGATSGAVTGDRHADIHLTAEAAPRRRASPGEGSVKGVSLTDSTRGTAPQDPFRQAVIGSVALATGTRGSIDAIAVPGNGVTLGTTPSVGSTPVYSSLEFDVSPPRLLRPQLPKEPAPGADTGYFDLLVDESGDVEFVKLISPAHRYQDRMLVAAAKAWKFKPATLHGMPVKYRLRVSIILQDPPR